MIWEQKVRTTVYVVDPQTDDYVNLVPGNAIVGSNTNVVFFRSGQEALRSAAVDKPAMWVINVRLPDMSGTDLQSILKSKGCKAPIALVGDEYSVDDEMTARCAGAEMYFAKPISHQVLTAAA
jgi:FixJ family two-component response regulator